MALLTNCISFFEISFRGPVKSHSCDAAEKVEVQNKKLKSHPNTGKPTIAFLLNGFLSKTRGNAPDLRPDNGIQI